MVYNYNSGDVYREGYKVSPHTVGPNRSIMSLSIPVKAFLAPKSIHNAIAVRLTLMYGTPSNPPSFTLFRTHPQASLATPFWVTGRSTRFSLPARQHL